ncbi:MAG: SAM-dependent methyltransferase [Ginsengibacter sp.]
MNPLNTVYLVPSLLDENALETIPVYIIDTIKNCQVIFAENERSTRRYLKKIYPEISIDNFEWFTIHKKENEQVGVFREKIKEGKNIAIISEAGCPGVADPGQLLVKAAYELNVRVRPLVGPSSVLLALMASGMSGQQFRFVGYLPIELKEKTTRIRELEDESGRKKCTEIFIETPYRNNQLIETLLNVCRPSTLLCIASELTSKNEFITTMSVLEWKKLKIDMHKKPAIFLLFANIN